MNIKYILMSALAAVGSVFGTFAAADAGCVRSKLIVADPVVVTTGKNQAKVRMKVTNNLPWPVSTVLLHYTVFSKSTGNTIVADPISVTIPDDGIAPGETDEVLTPFFGLPGVSSRSSGARVVVNDVADPSGNQVVHDIEVIGLGWTGHKSKQGCE